MTRELISNDIVGDDDGYTVEAFVQGQDRLYPSTRFAFRPVTVLERARILDARRNLNEQQVVAHLAKALCARILSWNAVDRKGNSLPLSIESFLKKLNVELFYRLNNIVINGSDGGDVDPDGTLSESDIANIPDPFGDDKGVTEAEQKN